MILGADSWKPPTQEVLDYLKELHGFSFFCGYVGGSDLYMNTPWPKEAWDLLLSNGIQPLPVYVPKQDCSENPKWVAQDAIRCCQTVGLHGLVAIDSEKSMSTSLNYQFFLDEVASAIHMGGWRTVTYGGSGYIATGSFAWRVVWGQHEDIPAPGEALQYGPYELYDKRGNPLARLDSDSADESFPFASFATPLNPVPPTIINGRKIMDAKIGVNPRNNHLIIIGTDPSQTPPHLMYFEEIGVDVWNVIDVTDSATATAHHNNPADTRTYFVE